MMTHDTCPSPSVLSPCVCSPSLALSLFLCSLSLSPLSVPLSSFSHCFIYSLIVSHLYVIHINHTHSNSYSLHESPPSPTYFHVLFTVPAAHRVQLVSPACSWVKDHVLVAFCCCDKASCPKALTEDRIYFGSWFQWNRVHHGGGGGIAAESQSLKLRDHIFNGMQKAVNRKCPRL